MQTLRQILGNLDPVHRHAIDGQRGLDGRTTAPEGLAGATLVPLNQCEILLPSGVHGVGVGAHRVAGSAVNEQHDRITAIGAVDGDPLFDATDAHETLFADLGRSGVETAGEPEQENADDDGPRSFGASVARLARRSQK